MKIVQCCVCRYNCTIKVSKYCTLYKVRNKAILGLKDGVKSANSLPSLPFSLSVRLFNLSEEAAAFLIVHKNPHLSPDANGTRESVLRGTILVFGEEMRGGESQIRNCSEKRAFSVKISPKNSCEPNGRAYQRPRPPSLSHFSPAGQFSPIR